MPGTLGVVAILFLGYPFILQKLVMNFPCIGYECSLELFSSLIQVLQSDILFSIGGEGHVGTCMGVDDIFIFRDSDVQLNVFTRLVFLPG